MLSLDVTGRCRVPRRLEAILSLCLPHCAVIAHHFHVEVGVELELAALDPYLQLTFKLHHYIRLYVILGRQRVAYSIRVTVQYR